VTSSAWTVMLVNTFGLLLSFTRFSNLEYADASHLRNFALFLLLTLAPIEKIDNYILNGSRTSLIFFLLKSISSYITLLPVCPIKV